MPIFDFSALRHPWLWTPSLILAAFTAIFQAVIVARFGQVFYPLDDPYIHMAMARHLAEHGIYGVSLAGFSGSSSAPGWTFLLAAGYRILGAVSWLPLAINFLAGFVLLALLAVHWRRHGGSRLTVIIGVAVLGFVLPWPVLASLGMEHTLHCLVVLILVAVVARSLTQQPARSSVLLLLAMSATLLRYESGFVIAPLVVLLLFERRWREAAVLAIGVALPVLAIGLAQMSQGWPFFPASIVRKSVLEQTGWQQVEQVFARLYGQLFAMPPLTLAFWLVVLRMVWGLRQGAFLRTQAGIGGFVFLIAAPLHTALASVGWYHRYEAYLLVIAAWALIPAWPAVGPFLNDLCAKQRSNPHRLLTSLTLGLLLLALIAPFSQRAASFVELVPRARNVFQQQYQMGRFLHRYYEGEAVLANDIGMINYMTDLICLDLMGLGSREPTLASEQERFNAEFLQGWARQHNAPIAVIYESWWLDRIPETWFKIGEWTLDHRVSAAEATVSFYATTPASAMQLYNHLQEYDPKLPDSVESALATPVNQSPAGDRSS